MAEKFNIYETVTAQIVAAMEAGTAPWRQPWTGKSGGAGLPLRSNGEPYRGVNVILLWLRAVEKSYASSYWFTFKQAQQLGAHVRKGEKSATVVKYGTVERDDEEGKERRIAYAKAYSVFNADQIEGLPAEFYSSTAVEPRDLGTEADSTLDAFFAATGAEIEITEDPQAYYNPARDLIHMPPIATFADTGAFYSVLAHEGVHWTGHKRRLDRLAQNRDRQGYAFEELVAEIGSCMVCATLGLAPDFDRSAAYLSSWLRALKDDQRLIFKAASEAQKAADFLLQAAAQRDWALAA